MRLTLLLTSPRVAPGLLTWGAWTAVASASLRLAASAEDPLARAVAGAGHPVQLLDGSASLMLEAARHDDVVWLASDEEAGRLPTELATALVDRPSEVVGDVEVEVLHGSYDVPGARLLDLVTVMDRLRSECPWDQQQTHRSLATYLLEETYETLEAIESQDYVHLREELGDLLLQVYFHARIAAEAGEDVRVTMHQLVHDAGLDVLDADEVNRNWETLKAAEKGRGSVLEGVPLGLPALALADKVVGRAARVGVTPAGSATLGERLLTLVVEARAAGADPEQELREAVRRLTEAVRAAESR